MALLLTAFLNAAFCQKPSRIDSLISLLSREKSISEKLNLYYALADNLLRTDPRKGVEYANEGLTIAQEIKNFKKQAEFKFILALNLYASGKPTESLINFKEALQLFEKLELTDGIARCHEKLGEYYNYSGDLNKAFDFFNKALSYYNSSGEKDVLNKAKVLQHLGVVSRFQNKHNQAIQYYKQCLEILNIKGSESSRLTLQFNLAELYTENGNYDLALAIYENAEALCRKNGNNRLLGKIAMSRSNLHWYREEYDKSEEYSLLAVKFGDKRTQMAGLIGLGDVYSKRKNYKASLEKYSEGIVFADQLQDKLAKSITINNRSRVSLDIAKDSAIDINLILGKTRTQVLEDAIRDLRQLVPINKEIGNQKALKENFLNLSFAYEMKGNYDSALANYKIVNDIADSIYSDETKVEFAKFHEQFESEKKSARIRQLQQDSSIQYLRFTNQALKLKEQSMLAEKSASALLVSDQAREIQQLEIERQRNLIIQKDLTLHSKEKDVALLQKDKALQAEIIAAEKNRRIFYTGGFLFLIIVIGSWWYYISQKRKLSFARKAAEAELKTLRLQMNPHFIFNSLNSISHYIQKTNTLVASDYLIDFSRLMRMVLENSRQPAISLSDELECLELYLSLESRRRKNFLQYEIVVSKDLDLENTLIPPMILQPFIENSIIHGLTTRTGREKISIHIRREEKLLKCLVIDNGVGLQPGGKDRDKDKKKQSLGIKITEQRIDILNQVKEAKGYVSVYNNSDRENSASGVSVEIGLPLEYRF